MRMLVNVAQPARRTARGSVPERVMVATERALRISVVAVARPRTYANRGTPVRTVVREVRVVIVVHPGKVVRVGTVCQLEIAPLGYGSVITAIVSPRVLFVTMIPIAGTVQMSMGVGHVHPHNLLVIMEIV